MTARELDALPEDATFTRQERIVDGRVVLVPVISSVGALWTKDDEPCSVTDDRDGSRWMIGWAKGVRYKRRMS